MNPSSSPFGNPSFSSGTPSFGFGPPSSTTHGLFSASPPIHTSSMFGSSSTPSFPSPQPAFANCAYRPFPLSSSSPFGTPSASPNPSTGTAASPSPFGASSPFHKPNPTTSGPVTFQFSPAKEEPRWGSPVNTADFDGVTISAEKAAILNNLKRKHPSCLSSLRLRSESHRRSAYEHLVLVIEELKAAVGRKGIWTSYGTELSWLDDLEIYGFDMGWLREEVLKLRDRTMEVVAEIEAKRKARDELVKQIVAIDA